jgi:hypothetical protein
MAAGTQDKGTPWSPDALLEIQRRNIDAITNAGQIVADGMRLAAERQASMMQEAMNEFWGEAGQAAAAGRPPTAQLEHVRGAFEKSMARMQELSELLLKVQGDVLAVLNACTAANMQALTRLGAPAFGAAYGQSTETVEQARRQAAAAVDELKKRMSDLERATKEAAQASAASTEEPSARRSGGSGGRGDKS